jgi:hypothetical protein
MVLAVGPFRVDNSAVVRTSGEKLMSAELSISILVVLVVVGSFALGTHINVRRGHEALRWLQDGLPLLGQKTTLNWLGSSVVRLQIEKPNLPFRRAEVLVVLEPRDVPPLWLLSRIRGRRDMLIVRTELRTIPHNALELLDHKSWGAGRIQHEVKELHWQSVPVNNPALVAYTPQALGTVPELLAEAERARLPFIRLSVREKNNTLELHWALGPIKAGEAKPVFEAVQRLAQRV